MLHKKIGLIIVSCIFTTSLFSAQTQTQKKDALTYTTAIKAKTAKEYKKAFDIFTSLSGKEYGRAKYNLALMYQLGQGTPVDEKKAVKLLEEAILLGDIQSMVLMGEKYYNGWGVSKDLKKVKVLIGDAKKAGNAKASFLWDKYNLSSI